MRIGTQDQFKEAAFAASDNAQPGRKALAGLSMVEVLVAVFVLSIIGAAFCGALSHGFGMLQATREDLRATQIMMQKLESVRLCTWNELGSQTFTAPYNPLATNADAFYSGTLVISPATNLINSPSYQANMRLVTVNVSWTSYNKASRVVHSRQMQSEVARYGMQNYIWGALK